MSSQASLRTDRRGVLQTLATGAGMGFGAMLAGCTGSTPHTVADSVAGTSGRRLKAAFSNAGLQSTWCKLGRDTAELWGKLLGVDVEWFDGEFDSQKQREKLDLIVDQDWDFCAFQAVQIDSLADPVERLKARNIPVLSMDTQLVEPAKMRETGVWCQVTPDQVFMGETSTQYLMNKINGRGRVIHIGGKDAHSGARGRNQGFLNVVARYPGVEVLGGGVRWCDWEKQKARNAFESLLAQSSEPIAGAFFHSDDMALACVPALAGTPHENMIITAVDGQKEGLQAIREGRLAATTVNPVCLIHMTALVVGQFIVRNAEPLDSVPQEIITPGPLVSQESGNLEAMLYLADPRHCLV